jgi:hypothetical protein
LRKLFDIQPHQFFARRFARALSAEVVSGVGDRDYLT